MPNKTPSYKDKVLKEFDEEFDGSLWSDPDSLAIPKYREVNNFIIKALEEQAKEFLAVFPEDTRTQIYEKSRLKENLKSKGLL